VDDCGNTNGDVVNVWDNGSGFTVSILTTGQGNYNVMVTDALGQSILNKNIFTNEGYNEIVLPVSLATSVYFVTVANEANVVTKKLMKLTY
jgi:hypothetical protein